jgi:hypothetical protein
VYLHNTTASASARVRYCTSFSYANLFVYEGFYQKPNSLKMEEQFCLKWNDFETNFQSSFQELRKNEAFLDVTLACEDKEFQAHRVILSSCSSFFRSILQANKHQHPWFYLKGIKHEELSSLLDFIYNGEVNISQAALNNFLKVAEDLSVKGLTQTATNSFSNNVKRSRSNSVEHVNNKKQTQIHEPRARTHFARTNNSVISGHYNCRTARLQSRTGSARTLLGP